MRFWDYLVQDIHSFDISNPANIQTTKFDKTPISLQKFVKTPDKSVAIIQPTNFDQILEFIDFISGNRSAVLDFNMLQKEDMLRAIDFVSGAVCALHGKMEQVSEGIFLYVPSCTKLITQKRKKHTNEK